MQHVIQDRWSRGSSVIHRLDARAKLATLLIFLIAISTTPAHAQMAFAGYALLLAASVVLAGNRWKAVMARMLLVLPFSVTFALVTLVSGNPAAALSLTEKSLLSGLAVVVMMSATSFLQLIAALEWAHVPRFLVLVIQFLYRYLFVVSAQANQMRMAARSRQGFRRGTSHRFRAAAGAVGVLFARSFERADGVYRAMVARGFTGALPSKAPARLQISDVAICGAGAIAAIAVRLWMARVSS